MTADIRRPNHNPNRHPEHEPEREDLVDLWEQAGIILKNYFTNKDGDKKSSDIKLGDIIELEDPSLEDAGIRFIVTGYDADDGEFAIKLELRGPIRDDGEFADDTILVRDEEILVIKASGDFEYRAGLGVYDTEGNTKPNPAIEEQKQIALDNVNNNPALMLEALAKIDDLRKNRLPVSQLDQFKVIQFSEQIRNFGVNKPTAIPQTGN